MGCRDFIEPDAFAATSGWHGAGRWGESVQVPFPDGEGESHTMFGPCRRTARRHRTPVVLIWAVWLALVACQKQPATEHAGQTPKPETPKPETSKGSAARSLLPDDFGETAGSEHRTLELPSGYGRHTGDLDEMVKGRAIRALVVIDPIGFFYLSGRPHGLQFEWLQEFETFANRKLKTGKLPVRVVFLPVRQDQLEPALTQGLGD